MAFEAVLVSWPGQRIIDQSEDWLVVDKPTRIAVHGGVPGHDDVVTRLGHLLEDQGRGARLAVHHRLDRDASGVLFFVVNPRLNSLLSRAFAEHRLRRRYLAIVRDFRLPDRFSCEQYLLPQANGPTLCVEEGCGQKARTMGRVLGRRAGRALVELEPETGRRHQLRAHLAARGAPICGDLLYGGEPAPRLMLHAAELSIPDLERTFSACLPEEFSDYGRGESLGTTRRLERAIFDAAWLRAPLARRTDAMRLVNGEGDGLGGIVVERLGAHAVVELYSGEALARRQEIAKLTEALGADGVYVKCRVRGDVRKQDPAQLAPSLPDAGEPAPASAMVEEDGIRFEVTPGDGWDVGIYLDQRENRKLVRECARGREVLNLFSYTATFSVAAALGGAKRTVSVDLSRRAAERAARNFTHSGISLSASHRLITDDVFRWLRRARRRGERFDLVILDPPSFSTGPHGKVFRAKKDGVHLASQALALVRPGGELLVVSHERGLKTLELRRRLQAAARVSGQDIQKMRASTEPVDCPSARSAPFPSTSLWVTLANKARR